MSRPPYTRDWVCTVHNRPGDDPDEQACGAFLFKAAGAPVAEPVPADELAALTPAKPKRYKRRPEPTEVSASAFGALIIVSNGLGPEYAVPRDEFLALYEEIDGDELPEDAGALAKAPGVTTPAHPEGVSAEQHDFVKAPE
jgi:hypothetical protein